jgi:hypothetical protein
MRNEYKILVGKSEGKRPLRRQRHRWENNIKINLKETACGDGEWIHVPWERVDWQALLNRVMNLQVP